MVELSCIVLAGGKSIRMGVDKRDLKLGNETFLEIALTNAKKISSDVIVSLGGENQVVEGIGDARIVYDEERERGPLYALAASLKKCERGYAALLPVDAPLVNPCIYDRMVDEIRKDTLIEAVIPRGFYGPEPLFGVYNVMSFREAIEKTVSKSREQVVEAVTHLKNAIFLDLDEFKDVDPKLLSFRNVNTPFDLERLKEEIDDKKRQ